MSEHHDHDTPVPLGPLLGAGALLVFALGAVAISRMSGPSLAPDRLPALVSVDLRFEDGEDGSVVAVDHLRGESRQAFPPGGNGFARATLRGLARDRKPLGIGPEVPFRLTRWADGRLTLDDLATGRRIALDAFGADNALPFARLIEDRRAAR